MKLKQLEIFAAVAKHQNLTRAAELLRVSQPAVSKGLKLLEEHLNTVLHRRNGHGIQLTDEGWRFLPQVDAFLKDRDRLAKNFITGRNHERSESFVIGASYGPSASLVPSIMAVFQKNYPHIQLDLRTDNREVIEKLLLKLEIEIAVVANKCKSPFIVIEPYRREKLELFVSASHSLAKKEGLTLSNVLQTPLVIKGSHRVQGRTRQILRELESRGYHPRIAACCDSPDAVKAAVKRKMGAGILYRDVIEPDVRKGDFKILKVSGLELHGESFIVYHKERELTAHAQAFLMLLRKWRGQRRQLRRPLTATSTFFAGSINFFASLSVILSLC